LKVTPRDLERVTRCLNAAIACRDKPREAVDAEDNDRALMRLILAHQTIVGILVAKDMSTVCAELGYVSIDALYESLAESIDFARRMDKHAKQLYDLNDTYFEVPNWAA